MLSVEGIAEGREDDRDGESDHAQLMERTRSAGRFASSAREDGTQRHARDDCRTGADERESLADNDWQKIRV